MLMAMIAGIAFDAVEQILVRLEVKDLIRCKRVCKSWYSLISSRSFVKIQLKYSCNNDDLNLLVGGHRRVAITYIPEDSFAYYYAYDIVGSSNGLVCGIDKQHLLVTNPLTAELRKVPLSPAPFEYLFGFGYDPCVDDYKVITVGVDSWDCLQESQDVPTYFHVFTLSSAAWRFIGQVNYGYTKSDRSGILCDGALHWFMRSYQNGRKVILSLDLSTEEFKEIPQPELLDEYQRNDDYRLGVVQGCLCIYNHKSSSSNKWLYNKQRSWELIPCDYEVENVLHYLRTPGDFTPIDHRCHGIRSSSAWDFIRAPIYVQSLVSPHANYNDNNYNNRNNNNNMGRLRKRTKNKVRPTQTQNYKRRAKTCSYRYLYPKPFHFSQFSRATYTWKRMRMVRRFLTRH